MTRHFFMCACPLIIIISFSFSFSPCIIMSSPAVPLLGSGDDGGGGGGVLMRRVVDIGEAKAQLLFALPMVLTNMCYYAIPLVSVMFAGHLGDLHLAGANLANSWCAVTGLALMIGLSGALETFCGQGYGAKLYRMLGVYLQASLIVSIFFAILISVLWYYGEPLFILMRQDPQVSHMAGIYLKYMIPGIFAYGFLQCLLRFLQAQTMVVPLVVCSATPLLLHIGITYLFVHGFGLGYKGAPIAASFSLWISFLMLSLYIIYSKEFEGTWEGLSVESLTYLVPTMKLAIPSAAMVCLEYWAFELLVLVSGLLPNSAYNTSLIAMCVNTEAIAYMITYGFAAVASTRVANEIGRGNSEKAKNVVSVTLKLSIVLALMVVLLLAVGHNIWAELFSSSSTIIEGFSYMTPLLMVSIVFDSTQGVLSGVSRGSGWQHLAAWTNLIAFYVVGMPLAVFLAFKTGLRDKVYSCRDYGLALYAASYVSLVLFSS